MLVCSSSDLTWLLWLELCIHDSRPGYCKRGPEFFAEAIFRFGPRSLAVGCSAVLLLLVKVMPDAHPLRGNKFKVTFSYLE